MTRCAGIIAGEGGTCRTVTADVGDADPVRDAVQACLDAFGRIDILVNNVRIARVALDRINSRTGVSASTPSRTPAAPSPTTTSSTAA